MHVASKWERAAQQGFARRGVPKRVIGEAALRDALAGVGAGRH